MTINVDTTVTQTGSWRTTGVWNQIGGETSVPTAVPPTSTPNVSLRVRTRRSGGKTVGFTSRNGTEPPLKANRLSYLREVGISEAGHSNRRSLNPPTTYNYASFSSSGTSSSTYYLPGFRLANAGEISDCEAKASNRLLKNVKDQIFNAAQAFAERKQTSRLIGTTAIRIASCIRNLRKGDFAGAAKAVGVEPRKRARSRFNKAFARRQGEAVSRGWLELQYGWKPLLNDIYGSADTLARRNSQTSYVTRRVSETRTIDSSSFSSVTSGKSLRTTLDIKGTCKLTVKFSVTYRTPDPTQSLPAQLGLTNPLLIAWELMPFSFVVDWFLPLGQAISNLDATRGAEFYCGHKTVFLEAKGSGVRSVSGVDQYNDHYSVHLVSSNAIVSCERTPLGAFPTPSLPRFKNPVSFLHAANGLALLTQLFRKR